MSVDRIEVHCEFVELNVLKLNLPSFSYLNDISLGQETQMLLKNLNALLKDSLIHLMMSVFISILNRVRNVKNCLMAVLGTGRFAAGFSEKVILIALTPAEDEPFTFLSAAVVVVARDHTFARAMIW